MTHYLSDPWFLLCYWSNHIGSDPVTNFYAFRKREKEFLTMENGIERQKWFLALKEIIVQSSRDSYFVNLLQLFQTVSQLRNNARRVLIVCRSLTHRGIWAVRQ